MISITEFIMFPYTNASPSNVKIKIISKIIAIITSYFSIKKLQFSFLKYIQKNNEKLANKNFEKITVKLNICTFFLNSITGISFKVEKIYNAI